MTVVCFTVLYVCVVFYFVIRYKEKNRIDLQTEP